MYHEPSFEPVRDEMMEILKKHIPVLQRNELVSVENALGRVCAEDVTAPYNLPNTKVSSFDGIAVKFSSFADGMPDTSGWQEGREYVFSNTGMAIPEEYDTVIAIEDVTVKDDGGITVHLPPEHEGFYVNPPGSQMKQGEVLAGKGMWEEELAGNKFLTSAPSFFQVNTAQAEKLVEQVMEGLGGVKGLLVGDLYAGGGTFSIPLSKAGADVIAIEAAGSSVRDLRRNAEINNADVDVIGGDAAREIKNIGGLDVLVVDPPRAGLANGVVEDIAAAAPTRVAYVSCNATTWARDVVKFESNGYQLVSVQPVDLFPQTFHCEVVSIFQRL